MERDTFIFTEIMAKEMGGYSSLMEDSWDWGHVMVELPFTQRCSLPIVFDELVSDMLKPISAYIY